MAKIRKTEKDEGKKDTEKNPPSPAKAGLRKGKKEYTGSRWAALILLIVTVVLGLWFYIDGLGGWQGLGRAALGAMPSFGWEKTYTFGEE